MNKKEEVIEYFRAHPDMSQNDMAIQLHLHPNTISKYLQEEKQKRDYAVLLQKQNRKKFQCD